MPTSSTARPAWGSGSSRGGSPASCSATRRELRAAAIPTSTSSSRSAPARREAIAKHAAGLSETEIAALARTAGGRLGRALELLDPAATRRRAELIRVARAVYTDPGFDTATATEALLSGIDERGAE